MAVKLPEWLDELKNKKADISWLAVNVIKHRPHYKTIYKEGFDAGAKAVLDEVELLIDASDELMELMDLCVSKEYDPDTFTTQPMKIALEKWNKKMRDE